MAHVRADSPFEISKNYLDVHGDQGNVPIFDCMHLFVNSCIFLKLRVFFSVVQVQPPSRLLQYPFNDNITAPVMLHGAVEFLSI